MMIGRSLRGQVLIAVLVALGAAQLAGFLIAAQTRETALRNLRISEAIESAAALSLVLDEAPPSARRALIRAAESPLTRYRVGTQPRVRNSDASLEKYLHPLKGVLSGYSETNARISFETIRERGPKHHPLLDEDDKERSERQRNYRRLIADRGLSGDWLHISLPMAGGLWLNTATAFPRLDPSMHWLAVVSFVLSVLLIGAVLWVILSRILGPVKRLSDAADAVGRGEDVSLPVTGPAEIRALTVAFDMMQTRLNHLVSGRTQMLAALGHDLRSPLTALRLRVEMLDDEEAKEKITLSLDEMSYMIEQTLTYARGVAAGEAVIEADLAVIIRELVEECAFMGCAIAWGQHEAVMIRLRPMAIRRALRNLLENACRYGLTPEVKLVQDKNYIVITISDRGPGIDEADLQRVFDPFTRAEASRSRETGGAGLGLSIARGIIQFHGGDITLSNRRNGGLRVTVALPRA